MEKATAEMESIGQEKFIRSDFGQMKEVSFDCKKTIWVFFEFIKYPGEDTLSAALQDYVKIIRYRLLVARLGN